jgi:hypothetical protein
MFLRRLKLNGLHGVISQKMILFITTAVKTSNPTKTVAVYCENHTGHTHPVGRMQSFSVLKQVVHILTTRL